MKTLTREAQKEIKQNCDEIYNYLILNFLPDGILDVRYDGFRKAIDALNKISFNCGLLDKTFREGDKHEE